MISVLVPFQADGGQRDKCFDWLSRRWAAFLPGSQFCVGQSDPFSRSGARNMAYQQSRGDILVIADADTMVRYHALQAALTIVQQPERKTWVLPYTTYFNLTQSYTADLLAKPSDVNPLDPDEWDHKLTTSESGVVVMTREAWETVGGYDELFIGWGYEDNAMALALDTLWGPRTQIPSSVFHLWHDVPSDGAFNSPSIGANRARHQRYVHANGNPDRMAQLRGLA